MLQVFSGTFWHTCAVSNMAVFIVSWLHAFLLCCLGIFRMIWDGASCLYYYWFQFCLYIPHASYFCCKVFIFCNLLSFFLGHIFFSWNCDIHEHTCSFSITTDYAVWFIVRVGWFHNMVTLTAWPVSTNIGTFLCQCSLFNSTPISMHMLKHIWAHSHVSLCTVLFASMGHAVTWSVVLSSCWHSVYFLFLFVIFSFVVVCNAWSCAAVTSLTVSAF